MALNLDSNPDYTDAQIVKHLRRCLVDAVFAQNWMHSGKSVGRMSALDIQKLIEIYESRVAASVSGTSGMRTLLAKFGNTR